MDVYRLNDDHCLQLEDYCKEAFQPTGQVMQPALSDHSSGSAPTMFGDNLGRMEEIPSGADMMSSDLGTRGAEGSLLLWNKPCREKATALDCKVCRKVFYNTSSLSKHMVTHSEKRDHICKVCKKAFKRQDHLMGHMLTHLKTKPFVCTESGCKKSYCDFRSLRRHYEAHHGLLANQQQGPASKPCLIPSKVLETGSVPAVLPNNEIKQFLQQKVTSNVVVLEDPSVNNVPQMMTVNSSMSNEEFASMTTRTSVKSSSKVSVDPDYVRYSNPSADNSLWNLLLLQSQKIQSVQDQPNSHSAWSPDEATVHRENMENSSEYTHSLDHRYVAPPASHGHETMRVQYSFTCGAGFTRLTIQPSQNSEFQDQNPANFFPKKSPPETSQTAALSLPSKSIPQCIPDTSGTRGLGDPQGVPTLSRIIGATENVTNKSQTGPEEDQRVTSVTGLENRLLSSSETWPKLRRSQCQSAINKEKLWFNLSSIVPARQVALESNKKMYRLSISNQGVSGTSVAELQVAILRSQAMFTWHNRRETIVRHCCYWCVESYEDIPLGVENRYAAEDDGKESVGCSQHKVEPTAPSLGSWTTKGTTVGQLVIPVSVPFTQTDQQKWEQVIGIRHTTIKGKKKRPCPKPLYIPPPVVENSSTSSGSYQSAMRSPHTPLSDYLLNDTIQRLYTPPPILSPIRRGTGLFFNTFCSASSAKYQPPSLIRKDTGEVFLVKDNIEYSVQPHINIGDGFQAVIPECRDCSGIEREDEKADLVWRPCVDTEAMSNFLNLACSSAVPGGGLNLELGLHFLHFSQGNVLEALDKLLLRGPLRLLLPPCLADYHYAGSIAFQISLETVAQAELMSSREACHRNFKPIINPCSVLSVLGSEFAMLKKIQKMLGILIQDHLSAYSSDHWSAAEKRQFKKAYSKEGKDFSYIQSMIPGKSIYQCVEYYYTWKMILSFERRQAPEHTLSAEEPHGKKEPHTAVTVKSKKQKKNAEPKENPPCSQKEIREGESPIKFVCRECSRAFEKIKSRNAHMKTHRLQEQHARTVSLKKAITHVDVTPWYET